MGERPGRRGVGVGRPWLALLTTIVLAGCASASSATENPAARSSPAPRPVPTLAGPPATTPTPIGLAGPPSARVPADATPAPTGGSTPWPIEGSTPIPVPGIQPDLGPSTLVPGPCPLPDTYTVAAGDTLYAIARRHAVTVAQLLLANPQIEDPNRISIGDRITISPVDLGTPGGSWSYASDINARGQVVGAYDTPSAVRPVLWQDGAMTDLETLGGSWGSARDINEAGQIVGESGTAAGDLHATLWQHGRAIDLGTLGGTESMATAINNRGQVVGWGDTQRADGAGVQRAFLWQDGTLTDLGSLAGGTTRAMGINDRGQVVGASVNAVGQEHAFLWQAGTMTDLGTLGGAQSTAYGINERRQVVGTSLTALGQKHTFLWQDGRMADLGGAVVRALSDSAAVNDCGQVVGTIELPDVPATGQAYLAGHAVLWYRGPHWPAP